MYARVHSLSKNISETAISSDISGLEPQVLTISHKVTLEKKEDKLKPIRKHRGSGYSLFQTYSFFPEE